MLKSTEETWPRKFARDSPNTPCPYEPESDQDANDDVELELLPPSTDLQSAWPLGEGQVFILGDEAFKLLDIPTSYNLIN